VSAFARVRRHQGRHTARRDPDEPLDPIWTTRRLSDEVCRAMRARARPPPDRGSGEARPYRCRVEGRPTRGL